VEEPLGGLVSFGEAGGGIGRSERWATCQVAWTSSWPSSAAIALARRAAWRSVSRSVPALDVPDAVEGVASAAPVAVGVLLDSAAGLVDCLGAELCDVEGVEHGDGIVEVVADGVVVAVGRVQGGLLTPAWNSGPRASSQAP